MAKLSLDSKHATPETINARPRGIKRLLLATVAIASLLSYSFKPCSKLVKERSYFLCSPPGTSKIYTVDEFDSLAECAYIHGERFKGVGSLHELKQEFSLKEDIPVSYIPDGAVVIPGMTDSHVHALTYGMLRQLPVGGTKSVEETVAIVANYVKNDPDILHDKSVFIEGSGFDHTAWGTGDEWPKAADFDKEEVLHGRKILLRSHDLHAYWVSPALLDSMTVPDTVEGGKIFRDEDGNPTGVFFDNARDLIPQPDPSEETLLKRWAFVEEDCHKNGFTSVHDALLDDLQINFLHSQAKKGNLNLRVYGMKEFDPSMMEYWGNKTDKIYGEGNGRFTLRAVKIVSDGALRTGGAALYEPYHDDPSFRGFFRVPPEDLHKYIPKFIEDGWQTNVHAIGDRTNGVVLDAFSECPLEDVKRIRPRLEHAQIMKEEDAKRVGPLGVISSIQPSHCISDMWFAEKRLGDRISTLYPFGNLKASGSRITLGSDFPVEDMNPFLGMYAAVTRLSLDGTSPNGPEGFFPEQRLTRLDVLRGYTINPAFASHAENITGSIEVGKRADYVVIDRDLMSVSERELADVKVLMTVLDGEVVYGKI